MPNYMTFWTKDEQISQKTLSLDTKKWKLQHQTWSRQSIPGSNIYTYLNLIIDSQNDKPILETVYRTKSGHIVKNLKQYEAWYY